MTIRNVFISILMLFIFVGCSNDRCKDRYIWSPRTIIITPDEAKSSGLIVTQGRVLTSASGFSWYDYQTAKKAGLPYCWPKVD